MPLNSKGCKAWIGEVYASTPNYQRVKIYTYKKNPPMAEKEFSVDFIELCYLRNNKTLVKKGDVIYVNAFTLSNGSKPTKGRTLYLNITDWELKDKYDYSKINIEYKGSDYEED